MIRVLLVDDEKNFIDGVSLLLEDYDCKCTVAYNGREGLSALEKSAFDVIVTDLIMPEMDGIAFLTEVHRLYPGIPSIVMTAHGGEKENRIVRALGAKNFILKPVDVDQLANMIDNLNESSRLASERDFFKEKLREHESKNDLTDLIGKSAATRQLVKVVMQVAPTNLSILVTGESGVGKQVVAESIHKNSLRSGAAFVDAHCASFSPTLLEDELFGHEKGAYTGAVSRKKGIFEKANGGTLFLDEIGEIPLSTQVKLLKVIEERKFTPLGSDREQESDFRLICATNRNLDDEVAKGNFREDLYYRINKMTIYVPPLREREDDIVLLCKKFMRRFSTEYKKKVDSISKEALDALCEYSWPGNVRELENAMETMIVMAKGEQIAFEDLPYKILKASAVSPSFAGRTAIRQEVMDIQQDKVRNVDASANGIKADDENSVRIEIGTMADMEAQIIAELLKRNKSNKTKVARILGINRKTLLSRLNKGDAADDS